MDLWKILRVGKFWRFNEESKELEEMEHRGIQEGRA